MSTFYVLITGASRGIGLCIVQRLAAPLVHVVVLGRAQSAALRDACAGAGAQLTFVKADLAATGALPSLFRDRVLSVVRREQAQRVLFVQNAGVAHTVCVGEQDDAAIEHAFAVNSVAPMLLTEAFVRHVQAWPVRKQILGISSGAARRAIPGWATYCATKASFEMMLKVLHEEQQSCEHPIKLCSYGPGVVMVRCGRRPAAHSNAAH